MREAAEEKANGNEINLHWKMNTPNQPNQSQFGEVLIRLLTNQTNASERDFRHTIIS